MHYRRHRLVLVKPRLLASMCGFLGVLTTVAVTWGLAAWLPHNNVLLHTEFARRPPGSRAAFQEVAQISRPGMTRREWLAVFPGGDGGTALPWQILHYTKSHQELASYWGKLPAMLNGRTVHRSHGVDDARGWPLLALWCGFEWRNDPAANARLIVVTSGGILLSDRDADVADVRALPFLPIWRGLILNTLFYAAIWALLLGVPWARPIIRGSRRARGLCSGCGYDLSGLTTRCCPECGRERT